MKVTKSKVKLLVTCCYILSHLGLRTLFSREKDFFIVKETSNVNDMLYWAKKERPDIILICAPLLLEGGIGLILKIKETIKKSKLIIFNSKMMLEQELIFVKEGVKGIVEANAEPGVLVKAVRKVHAGEFWIRRELFPLLLGSKLDSMKIPVDSHPPLTRREFEILKEIASNYSNHEIASKLYISEATVKTHINNIYNKLNIHDRMQATLYAIKANLLPSESHVNSGADT